MNMTLRFRKFALTAHVTMSVGWLGAVVLFVGLAIIGLTSPDVGTVRGVYLVMEPTGRYVLVPFAFAALLTGLVMSLVTTWGLFRHYWVVFKLMITVFAILVLLMYLETFGVLASIAADPGSDLAMMRSASPLLHAVLALLVLLVATVLAIYKPRGMTRYGWRKLYERRKTAKASPTQDAAGRGDAPAGAERHADAHSIDDGSAPSRRTSPMGTRRPLYWVVGLVAIVLLFILLHLINGIPAH